MTKLEHDIRERVAQMPELAAAPVAVELLRARAAEVRHIADMIEQQAPWVPLIASLVGALREREGRIEGLIAGMPPVSPTGDGRIVRSRDLRPLGGGVVNAG